MSADRPGARELIAMTLDPGSFIGWDVTPPALPIEESYASELHAARAATGEDESVVTGEGTLNGSRVAVVVSEFRFLGGSIGVNAAERIVTAVQRATAEGIPVLAAPVSGGTRMVRPGYLRIPRPRRSRSDQSPLSGWARSSDTPPPMSWCGSTTHCVFTSSYSHSASPGGSAAGRRARQREPEDGFFSGRQPAARTLPRALAGTRGRSPARGA